MILFINYRCFGLLPSRTKELTKEDRIICICAGALSYLTPAPKEHSNRRAFPPNDETLSVKADSVTANSRPPTEAGSAKDARESADTSSASAPPPTAGCYAADWTGEGAGRGRMSPAVALSGPPAQAEIDRSPAVLPPRDVTATKLAARTRSSLCVVYLHKKSVRRIFKINP